MEVEMKAKITFDQINKLTHDNFDKYYIPDWGEWEPLLKTDTFYSFNGERPIKPKNIVRIRKEFSRIKYVDFEELIKGKVGKEKFNRIEVFLTVKEKHTDDEGIETNQEIEGTLDSGAVEAFTKVMEITNFKPYFEKEKSSLSFYVIRNKDKKKMHCEIVSVNGVGPFLEIEVIVPDNISVPEDCESTQEAQELIKGFFKDVFNITEFDKRTWPQIIEDGN